MANMTESLYDSLRLGLSSQTSPQSPLDWSLFFDERKSLSINISANTQDTFTVYWKHVRKVSDAPPSAVFVLHHGAGHSALTWALTAKSISLFVSSMDESFDILCYDCRGHGCFSVLHRTSVTQDDSDLSLETLSDDLVKVVNEAYPTLPNQIVLVGHSMGGAIVVDVASKRKLGRNVLGVVLVDIVEGAALDSLKHMRSLLNNRPNHFKSVESAIQWRQITRASVPHQLASVKNKAGEEDFVWRTNLLKSERFWEGWFTDLSSKFVASPAAKLLILAGTERLDKPLTIGQMQGKFQMVVFPESGHVVQVF
ncbi:Protein phosphatase methylesterase 1 [Nowakowskiella sp. JEL0078]|nr:Protein phosphatase methylesterase 1 [Nowakowskiella sp. JEL0078]